MRPELPSLTALQAFEAALRHQSFTRAAEELGRTQGAVSRQVALLEAQLGVALFHREHPRVRPTRAAERFGLKLRALLDRLSALLLEMQAHTATGGVLHLAILPTLGTRWLIPRIKAFYRRHPDVSLQLTTRLGVFDFEVELLDAAIHYGEAVWPGARLEHLMDEEVAVVAGAELLASARLDRPQDLAAMPLLQLQSRLGAWDEWFAAVGAPGLRYQSAARFEHHLMVIQAAIAGLGVALLPSFLVREELASGALVEPFPQLRARTRRAYWLAYPERSLELPALTALRDWLWERLQAEGLRQPTERALPGA
jgi:LysR family glycine cleavage system transcriptional activator